MKDIGFFSSKIPPEYGVCTPRAAANCGRLRLVYLTNRLIVESIYRFPSSCGPV